MGDVCGCVWVCVCIFLKKPERTSVQVERKRKEKKRKEKRISHHGLSVILFWLSYLYFVRDFKRSAAAVISTQFQIIIDILIMCTEEYLIACYKFKTRFSTFSVKQVPVFHLKQSFLTFLFFYF